jgi:hypothetical protein
MSALSGRKIKHLLGWTGEGSKLAMVAAKTLTVNNSITLAGTDATTMTFPSTSGTVVTTAASQTLTNKTITGSINTDIVKCSAQFDAVTGTTGATLTDVAGLVVTVVPGTYNFQVKLPCISTANTGFKCAFKYTTTVLSSIDCLARGMIAAGSATSRSTTTTDQALMFDTAAGVEMGVLLDGIMVVTTGGTVKLQAAQHTAHADTVSVYTGATMQFTRIA